MARTEKTEVWRGSVIATYPDGSRWTTEHDATIVDDWRDTPFGPMNFGHVALGPMRHVRLAAADDAAESTNQPDRAAPRKTKGKTMTDTAPNLATMAAAEAILHSMNMGNDAGMRFLSD